MSLKDELGKMYGPLPLGAWIVVVGGGLAFLYYQRSQGAATTVDPSTLDNTSTDSGVGLGGVPAGYTYTGGDGTDTTGTDSNTTGGYADNNAWGAAAINYLISQGYAADQANNAIGAFINEGSPTTLQWLMIRSAEAYLGAPPDTITTQNNPPSGGSGTSTVYKPESTSYPTGTWYTNTAVQARNNAGKAVGPKRPAGYPVRVVQWGSINGTFYARSNVYYYPVSVLERTKPNTGKTPSSGSHNHSTAPAKPTKPKPKPKTPAKVTKPAAKTHTYTVKRGDNLTSIAHQFKVSWQSIFNANKSKIKNPNLIYAGQKLTIPR